MVTIVKHEWHQVDAQFAFELEKDLLEEIYPDMDEDELEELWQRVISGEADLDEIISDAWNNDVEIEWDRQYDDWWTDRKGGYDITYEYGDEDSWHHEPPPPEPTHKCTKCKWTGQSYDAQWSWTDKQGNEIDEPRKTCPYCESDVILTEHGIQEEKEKNERYAKIEKELNLGEDDES
jgi:ribosomal protein S27AE